MGHKSSEAGSDSEDSERRMQVKNWRKKKSSSKISPKGELRKKKDDRISSGGGGLEKDGCQNKKYNKTIPEEGVLEKDDGEQNTVNLHESPVRTEVMMVDLHCQGCIDKICEVIKKTKGYHGMSIDRQKNAVTVKGTMDMTALAKRLSKKLNKRPVSIAPPDDHGGLQADADSPSPAKDMVGAASKPGKGAEPQKDLDGNKSNKPPVTTTVLKVDVPCYCDGHSDGIRGVVANTKGFHSYDVSIDDMGKIVVRVTGSVDVNDLKKKLEKKLKKPVEITQPPPIFNDIDDGGDMGKSVGDGGETYTQDAPTWHLDPHMYGYYRAYYFP